MRKIGWYRESFHSLRPDLIGAEAFLLQTDHGRKILVRNLIPKLPACVVIESPNMGLQRVEKPLGATRCFIQRKDVLHAAHQIQI